MLVLAVCCALLLAACGGDGGSGGGGIYGSGGGNDSGNGLTQRIYQGTQPSIGDLAVGVANIFESGAQLVVFGHDPDAETSETFTELQEGDTFRAGVYTFEILEIGEDDEGDYAEVKITPAPR